MSRFLATHRPLDKGKDNSSTAGSANAVAAAKLVLSPAVAFPNRVLLAPLSGVTDLPFRRLAHRFGAGAVVSEMVAAEGLIARDFENAIRLEGQGIAPHVVQIAGCDAAVMAEGARIAEGSGADVIDINMGCPAKRVNNRLSGSALMRDLDHAVSLIEAVAGAVSVPVTVKMRLGWDDASHNAAQLAARAEQAGVAMVTVHARTRCQFYKGAADWSKVRAVSEAVSVPVIVNGDIVDAATARLALQQSGAAGVMIGRGAVGQPWVPGHVAAALATGTMPPPPPDSEIRDICIGLHAAMLSHYGHAIGIRMARKHLAAALELFGWAAPGAAALKSSILTAEDGATVSSGLVRWFDARAGWPVPSPVPAGVSGAAPAPRTRTAA